MWIFFKYALVSYVVLILNWVCIVLNICVLKNWSGDFSTQSLNVTSNIIYFKKVANMVENDSQNLVNDKKQYEKTEMELDVPAAVETTTKVFTIESILFKIILLIMGL